MILNLVKKMIFSTSIPLGNLTQEERFIESKNSAHPKLG